MIIAKIIGGLGNQMFQYAFARKLALKHGVELKLDISGFEKHLNSDNYTNRNFELPVFNIAQNIATDEEIAIFRKSKVGKIKDNLSLRLGLGSSNFYLREPYAHFFEKALKAPANTYIDGYWHSEKYFSDIREILMKDFEIKAPLSTETISIAEKLKRNGNSVSIHVRRGDYISNFLNTKIYAQCDADYYLRAIDYIARSISDPHFYVLSDEPEWFAQHVQTDHPVEYVNYDLTKKNYEDLYIMSQCKHNIIANSSFSWWGAWLNRNSDKIVVAPEKWYIDDSKNAKDIIPDKWTSI